MDFKQLQKCEGFSVVIVLEIVINRILYLLSDVSSE